MRARGERRGAGRHSNPTESVGLTTGELAEQAGMSTTVYRDRHRIGRGITEETADVLDSAGRPLLVLEGLPVEAPLVVGPTKSGRTTSGY